MNDVTKALLKDLQADLDLMKGLETNIEVVWQLQKMKEAVELSMKLILKSIQ